MAVRVPGIMQAKHFLHQSRMFSNQANVPKGHIAVYDGESPKKRFVIRVSLLNRPSFQELLRKNSSSIIQQVVSQFLAEKTSSLISILV